MDGSNHFIGGAFDPGLGTRTGPVYNPATGEVAYQLHYADRATLDRVCEIARKAGRDWGNSSHARRTPVARPSFSRCGSWSSATPRSWPS